MRKINVYSLPYELLRCRRSNFKFEIEYYIYKKFQKVHIDLELIKAPIKTHLMW